MVLSSNADLRTRLAALDASIAELRLRLKGLEDLRRPIQRQLDYIIYPVLTLPPEITSHIFLHCLPHPLPGLDDCDKYAPNTKLVPLLLLQVCRTWRDIVLSTPYLWNSLHLGRGMFLGADIAKIVADWFDRAGSCPLTFNFHLPRGSRREFASPVLHGLAPRIQTLGLHLGAVDSKDLIGIGPFPILESLAISYRWSPSFELPLELFTAPRLRHISLTRYARPRMFVIPHDVYTVACAAPITVNESLDVLQGHPFLKELKINCYLGYRDTTSRTEIVTHNNLETLHLVSGASVLRLSRLPALQNLHLSGELDNNDGDLLPAFLAFTSLRYFRTDHRITSLSVEWFTAMSGLVDVELCAPEYQFFCDFFARMDRTKDSGFLPHLRTLVFRDCACQLDASALRALSSRSTSDDKTTKLESFQIWLARKIALISWDDDLTIAACRELVRQGMAVYVGAEGQNFV
ncbi:hypothetical protein B0H16DRAFT_1537114 [Mycena metata]|uniref:F-box domain-containing protein n=1 Tax=Mycena metata TaxID=1033252 RepID=A0AAD7J6U3_9AGAR|nr:hypothetical protein B0H16DRAFT_1537114 [Mycena metata]